MENYRFVTIGIDRYRFLPPLGGSKACLWELQRCLRERIAIAAKQTLLFSDRRSFSESSRHLWGQERVIYPNGNNLRRALSRHCQGLFFQGYATQFQGEDYLLPIDAQTDYLEETAISLRSLLTSLKHPHSVPAWLLLDLVSLDLNNPISINVLLEAKALGINVIARFHPRGGEPGDLGTAFVEALGYYEEALNLELLELYLRDKIPNYYGNESLIILTGLNNNSLTPVLPSRLTLSRFFSPGRKNKSQSFLSSSEQSSLTEEDADLTEVTSKKQRKKFGFLSITLGLFFLFLALIIFGIHSLTRQKKVPQKRLELQVITPKTSESERLQLAKSYLQWQQASVFVRAIAELRQISQDSPSYDASQQQISLWSQIILGIAQGRAQVGNWQDAIAAAELVPSDQPKLYEEARRLIEEWQAKKNQPSEQEQILPP